MSHGHPESEEYSQSVKDGKAALRLGMCAPGWVIIESLGYLSGGA